MLSQVGIPVKVSRKMRETWRRDMSDTLSIENRKTIFDYSRDHWDHHIKNVNYLLVAHGATLLGCLTALKDYNSTPQLKGIGILILIACIGMAAAAVAHGLIS